MKKGIIVSSVVLRNAFKECTKVKPIKSIPITESFLLECSPKRTFLVRSNLEDTVKVELGCECNFTGTFLLEASIGKLMAKVEEQPVSINIIDDDVNIVYVYGEDFQTKIVVGDPGNYISREKEYSEVGSMSYNELRSKLERLVPFLSTDGLRPALTGFCFDEKNIVATNGHIVMRISYCGFDVKAKESPHNNFKGRDGIIVSNIFKYLPKNKLEDVITFSLSTDRSCVKIEFHNHVIYSRLIDEGFPDYKSVWPSGFVTEFNLGSLGSLGFKRTIDQALIFANQSTKMIVINVSDKLNVHAEDIDYATEFNKTIEGVDISGEPMKFAVNGKLLADCLRQVSGDIKFQLKAPNQALILNDDILLMPILITD